MKKSLSILLSLVMILTALPLTAVNSFAADNTVYTSGDWSYRILSDGTAEIYKNLEQAAYSENVTDLTIPSQIDGYAVTSIGDYAFYDCDSLKSIIIPNSVTNIGDLVFCNCTSLTNIRIPDTITSIGYFAFCNCTSLTSVTIPNTVTNIGGAAFEYCISLTSITIPNSVRSIGYEAFFGCTSLTSITIPDSVTSIGNSTFYNAAYYNNEDNWEDGVLYIGNHLIEAKSENVPKDHKIKEGTITIADDAFYNCISLVNVTIPNSVANIGNSAFFNCTSLISIILPDSVASIGYYAFDKCKNLKTVYYSGSETDWKNISICDYNDPLTNANIIYVLHTETDINGDGKLTVVDAKWVLQSVAGTRTLTDEQKIAADVNGDDKVTVVDAKWILQAIAGMRDLSKK